MYQLNQRPDNTQRGEPTEPQAEPGGGQPGSGGQSGGSILGEVQRETQMREQLHQAVGATLNAQKIMGNALDPVIAFHANERARAEEAISDDAFMERVETRQSEFMQYVGQQSKRLKDALEAGGVDLSEDWARARLTSTVADYAGQYYRHVGPKVFELSVAEHLSQSQSIEGVWTTNALSRAPAGAQDSSARRAQQMLSAMAPVVAAMEQFDYFQPDRQATLVRMSEMVEAVVEDTLTRHEAFERMSDDDLEALRGNLLYRGGQILSECWHAQMRETLNEIREMDVEERRMVMAQGFPLDQVESHFHGYFQMIQQTTLIALSQHSGMDIVGAGATASDSPSPG